MVLEYLTHYKLNEKCNQSQFKLYLEMKQPRNEGNIWLGIIQTCKADL